ncbi:MAG TPA: TPM domain-containing protein [Candidatus Cybelea sp.]|jgi:uncharacterized protein
MKFRSARVGAALAFFAALSLTALSASARDFVQDQAGMFSAATVAQLNEQISSFNSATGKEIVVMTVPSLGGATLQSAAASAFSQQSVNGVLIFIARDDRRDIIVPDRSGVQAGWFTPDVLRDIRTTMETQFRSENYDAGITGAVASVLSVYRAHSGQRVQPQSGTAGAGVPAAYRASRMRHIPMFWWIIIIAVGFLILRSVLRAASGPRYYGSAGSAPPGAAPGAPPGAGYGPAPGYGYGGFGGGGSFWSGLLGGLGGAWLGNELFRGGGGAIAPTDAGQVAGQDAGGGWGGADSGGWQSDAGQADMGGASGGDWSGGGFGDSGGGGDFGGGGGDSGGGW